MGQIGSCTCENVFFVELTGNEAIIEAKPCKKKHEITKIRNRINSVINPLKLPKFEELLLPTTPRVQVNRQSRKAEKLTLVCEDPQRSVVMNVPASSTGPVCFEVGTDQDISPQYKIEVDDEKDEFRLSVKFFQAVNSDGQEQGKFFIRDEAVGLGCFARLRPAEMIQITNGMLINIGNEFIVPCFVSGAATDSSRHETNKVLEIKLYGGYAKGEMLELQCGHQDCVVNVGRARHCRLVLYDPILSKIQCRFVRRNRRWYILDGSENDPSTNGTWVYMSNIIKVENGLQIRCGSQYYHCEVEKQQQVQQSEHIQNK